jgi:branched-chain amino acid transport system permease protein
VIVDILQTLVSGILVGAAYALMCVGLGLIFGVMRVVNFAQGEFVMLGMYAALFVATTLGLQSFVGEAPGAVAGGLLAGPIVFAAAWALHRALVGRVTGRTSTTTRDPHSSQVVMTLGISLALQNGAMILFGSRPRSVPSPWSSDSFEIGELLVNKGQLVAFVVAIVIVVVLAWWLDRSAAGRELRAASENARAAQFVGIDVVRAHRLSFAIGAGISAIAGGLMASLQAFQPYVGIDYVIVMYAGVVLGGLGSIKGAFIGGMLIGIVQQMATLVLPQQLQNAVIFVVFLLVVLLRPQGLFGRVADRV